MKHNKLLPLVWNSCFHFQSHKNKDREAVNEPQGDLLLCTLVSTECHVHEASQLFSVKAIRLCTLQTSNAK